MVTVGPVPDRLASMATVRVRLFARQRQIAGSREVNVELADGATVADAWAAVVALFPALGTDTPYVRYGRNGTYAAADEAVAEGDEVSCIPPVAGGSARAEGKPTAGGHAADESGARARGVLLEFTDSPIDAALIAHLLEATQSPGDGAQAVFIGRTRETSGTPAPGQEADAARHSGQRVLRLDYEAYESMALAVFEAIAAEVGERFGVERMAILHRTGPVVVGEVSVAIVVATPHRDAAFDACRYAIDELKARAPIWKAEQFENGSVWLGAPAREGPVVGS